MPVNTKVEWLTRIPSWTVPQLRAGLATLGRPTTGLKAALVANLTAYVSGRPATWTHTFDPTAIGGGTPPPPPANPPHITNVTPSPINPIREGDSVGIDVTVTNGVGTRVFSLQAGANPVPAWATIHAASGHGNIAPPAGSHGHYDLRLRVEDDNHDTDEAPLVFDVYAPMRFTNPIPANIVGRVGGAPLDLDLSITDGRGAVTITITGFPAGISRTGDHLTGSYTAAGTGTIHVVGDDGSGTPLTADIPYVIHPRLELAAGFTAMPNATASLAYDEPVQVQGVVGTASYSLPVGHPWASIHAVTGHVTGTSGTPGSNPLTFRVTDSADGTSEDFNVPLMTVAAPDFTPAAFPPVPAGTLPPGPPPGQIVLTPTVAGSTIAYNGAASTGLTTPGSPAFIGGMLGTSLHFSRAPYNNHEVQVHHLAFDVTPPGGTPTRIWRDLEVTHANVSWWRRIWNSIPVWMRRFIIGGGILVLLVLLAWVITSRGHDDNVGKPIPAASATPQGDSLRTEVLNALKKADADSTSTQIKNTVAKYVPDEDKAKVISTAINDGLDTTDKAKIKRDDVKDALIEAVKADDDKATASDLADDMAKAVRKLIASAAAKVTPTPDVSKQPPATQTPGNQPGNNNPPATPVTGPSNPPSTPTTGNNNQSSTNDCITPGPAATVSQITSVLGIAMGPFVDKPAGPSGNAPALSCGTMAPSGSLRLPPNLPVSCSWSSSVPLYSGRTLKRGSAAILRLLDRGAGTVQVMSIGSLNNDTYIGASPGQKGVNLDAWSTPCLKSWNHQWQDACQEALDVANNGIDSIDPRSLKITLDGYTVTDKTNCGELAQQILKDQQQKR